MPSEFARAIPPPKTAVYEVRECRTSPASRQLVVLCTFTCADFEWMTISLSRTTSITSTASQSHTPIRNTKRFNRTTRSVCLRGDPARTGRAWATLPNHSHRVKLLHVYTAPVCFSSPELRPLPCRCPRSARSSKLWGDRVPPTTHASKTQESAS